MLDLSKLNKSQKKLSNHGIYCAVVEHCTGKQLHNIVCANIIEIRSVN